METTHKTDEIVIRFERTDSSTMRRFVEAKIEEINCIVMTMYNTNLDEKERNKINVARKE